MQRRGAPGSSPRVRGAVGKRVVSVFHKGIIPACAGSRDVRMDRIALGRDHPRVCGEQVITPVA